MWVERMSLTACRRLRPWHRLERFGMEHWWCPPTRRTILRLSSAKARDDLQSLDETLETSRTPDLRSFPSAPVRLSTDGSTLLDDEEIDMDVLMGTEELSDTDVSDAHEQSREQAADFRRRTGTIVLPQALRDKTDSLLKGFSFSDVLRRARQLKTGRDRPGRSQFVGAPADFYDRLGTPEGLGFWPIVSRRLLG